MRNLDSRYSIVNYYGFLLQIHASNVKRREKRDTAKWEMHVHALTTMVSDLHVGMQIMAIFCLKPVRMEHFITSIHNSYPHLLIGFRRYLLISVDIEWANDQKWHGDVNGIYCEQIK